MVKRRWKKRAEKVFHKGNFLLPPSAACRGLYVIESSFVPLFHFLFPSPGLTVEIGWDHDVVYVLENRLVRRKSTILIWLTKFKWKRFQPTFSSIISFSLPSAFATSISLRSYDRGEVYVHKSFSKCAADCTIFLFDIEGREMKPMKEKC